MQHMSRYDMRCASKISQKKVPQENLGDNGGYLGNLTLITLPEKNVRGAWLGRNGVSCVRRELPLNLYFNRKKHKV